MNQLDLFNTLLYLVPNAQFTIWDTQDIAQYHGDPNPISIQGMFVDWSSLNTQPCPTDAEIEAVDINAVNASVAATAKTARDDAAKQDLTLVAAYNIAIVGRKDLTFSAFLDSLEQQQNTL